jgi:hypothetical protein
LKLTNVAVFAYGYFIGARAGRERYVQIVNVADRASERLAEFSSRHPPARRGDRSRAVDGGPGSRRAAV